MSTSPASDRTQLTRMTVSNYRSIGENVSIDFAPLTVLVGINGSGKSNLLDAPRFVAQALSEGLENAIDERHGFDSMLRDVGGRRGTARIGLELDHADWSATYSIEIGAPQRTPDQYSVRSEDLTLLNKIDGTTGSLSTNFRGTVTTSFQGLEKPVPDKRNLTLFTVGGDERLAPVVDAIRAIETYALFPEELRKIQSTNQRRYLNKLGSNFPWVVERVMASPAGRDIRLALDRLTNDIVDMRVRRYPGARIAIFDHRRSDGKTKAFDATRESDGTLRVAGMLTALAQAPPLTCIGIEEPELTVHAGVIPLLVDYLTEASRLSRVVVTTHSPELLDLVPVESIRVVDRIDGTTRVGRVDDGQQSLVKRRLASAGELLRAQGLQAAEI